MATASAASVAATVPAGADEGKSDGDTMYGHGMVWNRDLPGILGDLRLSFDLRVNLETGIGFGTAEDPVHPDWNIHFSIDSLRKEKRPGQGSHAQIKSKNRKESPET